MVEKHIIPHTAPPLPKAAEKPAPGTPAIPPAKRIEILESALRGLLDANAATINEARLNARLALGID